MTAAPGGSEQLKDASYVLLLRPLAIGLHLLRSIRYGAKLTGGEMKAYAVLAGGGVKAAALAGCLKAASENGVEFVGYAGASGGAIIALLASVGYSPEELRDIVVDELEFSRFLDDGGKRLESIKAELALLAARTSAWNVPAMMKKAKAFKTIHAALTEHLGLYDSKLLEKFLEDKIRSKHRGIGKHLSFQALAAAKCLPLKIIATDLESKAAVIYPRAGMEAESVLRAIRASACYPFVFQPVREDGKLLVDGGLSSNLPVVLFHEDHRRTRLPILAFRATPTAESSLEGVGLADYARVMLDTALEASDALLRGAVPGVEHILVDTGATIGTLSFSITKEQREGLFNAGQAATGSYLSQCKRIQIGRKGPANIQLELQYLHGPPQLFRKVLEAIVKEIHEKTTAEKVRVSIMLPTGRPDNSRIVVFSHGMDGHTDQALELGPDEGCSGEAMRNPDLMALWDLPNAPSPAGAAGQRTLDAGRQILVPLDRRSIASIALVGWTTADELLDEGALRRLPRIGALSIDSATPLAETGWMDGDKRVRKTFVDQLFGWSTVISRLLP